uniref:Pyruvate phosphate dikinase AMP/ATP-binding domain-containing protein n=1 Tax=Virgibacillus oceani TaxID=1479511 RepID=A0A917HMW8_9BACI|nr:hypothetical protein GCM10011398_32940 [Virgibacillus oceani]
MVFGKWKKAAKGLNLGKLSKIQGIQVPEGFCVTTEAYQMALEQIARFANTI